MLTERQQDTLDYIRNYIQSHGRSPLVSEIAKGLGLRSQGTTHRYIQALVDDLLVDLIVKSDDDQHQDNATAIIFRCK